MSRVGSGMCLGQSRDQTISSPVLPSLSDLRVGLLVGGSAIPEVEEAQPAWGTPAHVCLCGCFMPVAFLHGCQACFWVERSRKETCTKGSWWEGPAASVAPCLPGRAKGPLGSLGGTTPCYLLSAVCCPLSPATGVVAASPHSSCHPVCLGPSTPEDSSFQQPSVCSLPMGSLPK